MALTDTEITKGVLQLIVLFILLSQNGQPEYLLLLNL